MTWELAPLARLRPLRHLDLEIGRACEIRGRNAKAPGRHLLHGAVPRVAVHVWYVAVVVLPAFSGIAARADAVHRNCKCFMRLAADRAERYRTCSEALDDLTGGFYFVEGNGRRGILELEESADRTQTPTVLVRVAGELLERLVVVRARSVLQRGDGVGIPHVILAIPTPVVHAAGRQFMGAIPPLVGVGGLVPSDGLPLDLLDSDTANSRRSPREILVDELLIESDRFEYLRSSIALQRRDAHLGHGLHYALYDGFDVVLFGFLDVGSIRVGLLFGHLSDCFKREVRVHGSGAVAKEEG